jgi:peptidoglycan/LPS O-acetylase OafA/YrhL
VRSRIAGFDGLRAIAILMVFVTHRSVIGQAIGFGGSGVRLFFVLSGFLIIGILQERRLSLMAGRTSLGAELQHFYANRVYRIWPVYFLLVAVLLCMGWMGLWPRVSSQEFAALTTFTTNLFIGHVWPDFPDRWGAMWSLAVEEQFYLWAAPVFLLAAPRHFRAVCGVVMAIAVAALLTRESLGFPPRAAYCGSLTNFGLMALGGWMVLSGPQPKWLDRLAPVALIAYVTVPIVLWRVGQHSALATALSWGSGLLIGTVLKAIVADQGSSLVRVLEFGFLRWLGQISYGFYVYHGLISRNDFQRLFPVPPGTGFFIEFAASLLVAGLSWKYIEQPILALRDRRRARRAVSGRVATAAPEPGLPVTP